MLSRSLNIGTYGGIPLKIHWSFLFVFVYIAVISITQQLDLYASLSLGIHILLLFVCVVFHEYGHAIAAKRYGIKTRDIILSPIGGLARLESLPPKPKQELVVAFAGPLVNLVFFLFLLIVIYFLPEGTVNFESAMELNYFEHPGSVFVLLLIINAVLFLFNLIPAYPMDGGRILKALLNFKYSKSKATMIAASVGRIFAISFIAIGAYNRLIAFLLIGLFVYLMATREYHLAKGKHANILNQ